MGQIGPSIVPKMNTLNKSCNIGFENISKFSKIFILCQYEVSILKTKDLAKLDQIGTNWAKLDQVISQKLTHTINLALSDLKLLLDVQSYSFCVNMK